MKIRESIEAARLRAGAWLRERKERAEAKREEQADPAGVTVPLWLVNAAKFASWVATISLMYFLWLYTLDIARDRAGSMHLTHVGQWIGDIQFWFPYVAGFALIAFGIPYVAKIAIPTFMSLHWRGNFWPKLWALFIAIAVSLVVIAGTFAVQGNTIMERDRDAAVAVEQVQTGRSVLEARITAREAELRSMMENRNAYLAQAASVGAAEWQRSYIDQTSADDPQRERIVRAIGAARAADAVRADIQALREQTASSTAVASVQREVVTERTGWIAETLGWLEGARAILLSFVMDIVALMMPWIALRLEQARNRQMGLSVDSRASRWMPIEDRRGQGVREPLRQAARDVAEAMVAGGADPRFAADMARSAAQSGVHEEIVCDEDGAPLRKVEYYKREDGKPLIKNRLNRVVEEPGETPPHETGVPRERDGRDAELYAASMHQPVEESVAPAAEQNADDVSDEPARTNDSPEEERAADKAEAEVVEVVTDALPVQPEPSEETVADLNALVLDDGSFDANDGSAPVAEETAPQHDEDDAADDGAQHDQDEQQAQNEIPQREEPETDPARMIAAE